MPVDRTGMKIRYEGSCNWMGSEVPHFTSRECTLLMNHTSALKGDSPPKGRLMSLFSRGMLFVLSV